MYENIRFMHRFNTASNMIINLINDILRIISNTFDKSYILKFDQLKCNKIVKNDKFLHNQAVFPVNQSVQLYGKHKTMKILVSMQIRPLTKNCAL